MTLAKVFQFLWMTFLGITKDTQKFSCAKEPHYTVATVVLKEPHYTVVLSCK